MLPKVTSEGLSFMSNYCAYHRHNRHETSDCMELKNQIQDLIDDGIIQISKLSSTRDSTLKKDKHHETKSSNGSNATSTSSNMPSPTKASNLSSMPPPKKAPNSSAIDYVYLQGLPLKETQANLDLATSLSHTSQTKDPKPSCATTPIIPTPTSTSLSLQEPTMQTPHPTLSLELVSCQEDYLNNEETSVDQDQDSFIPFQIFQDLVPPSQEPHSSPSPISCTSTKQDHDISSTIPKEIINDQE